MISSTIRTRTRTLDVIDNRLTTNNMERNAARIIFNAYWMADTPIISSNNLLLSPPNVGDALIFDGDEGWWGYGPPIAKSTGPTGPEGGPIGPTGSDGATAFPGPIGPTGPLPIGGMFGPMGSDGPTGTVGPEGPEGARATMAEALGAGARGPAGEQGLTGHCGGSGPTGFAGFLGQPGPTGPDGPTGPVGARGSTGPDGGGGGEDPDLPAGVVVPSAISATMAASPGYVNCDGTVYATATYPDLYAAIGVTWGGVAGVNFSVPDFRGYFLRGADDGANVNPDGTDVGGVQAHALQEHQHAFYVGDGGGYAAHRLVNGPNDEAGAYQQPDGFNVRGVVGDASVHASETRPSCKSIRWMIKT
jgi:hypothetical protein